MTELASKTIDSPVGRLRLVASDRGLVAVLWAEDTHKRVPLGEMMERPEQSMLQGAERQLQEYFAGQRMEFSVPLDLRGTAFQREVWRALCEIPFGQTCSYGELAQKLGKPLAVRAVGAANGRNPVSIIVPCHRVIGASGRLTGFAGGVAVKAKLLALEQNAMPFCLRA